MDDGRVGRFGHLSLLLFRDCHLSFMLIIGDVLVVVTIGIFGQGILHDGCLRDSDLVIGLAEVVVEICFDLVVNL